MKMTQAAVWPEKTPPKDAETINHKLLVQAGFVRQLMAGVYTYLPMGLTVLNKIQHIVREEMDKVGGQEVLMPMLQPAEIWKTSGSWDSADVLFKLKSRTEKDYALGISQEEVATGLMKEFIRSYRDLPRAVYHIQWKFRDELRSKSGIMRGREFLMKDMYSFHESLEDFARYYEVVKTAYLNIFRRLGLDAKVTEASGGSFSDKISYEFEVITDAGEANVLFCSECDFCVNTDDINKYQVADKCPRCGKNNLSPAKAAEVGNIFDLGEKYTKSFDLTFADQNGSQRYPIMGCYGIGVSRTMGVIVEKFHDDKGIIWPSSVAPFAVYLISTRETMEKAEELYKELKERGVEVLFDDRDVAMGVKFADADLIGIPLRVLISEKSITSGGVEVKRRTDNKTEVITAEKLLTWL